MSEEQRRERVSKFLSLVLRHSPDRIGLTLDKNGWASVVELLDQAAKHGTAISSIELLEVVATSDKKRFAMSADGLLIRASQGHSVAAVDLDLPPATPPGTLFHGTASRFLASIKKEGLLAGSRNHVHLSVQRETANNVGQRHGTPIVLLVRAQAMHDQGHKFYLSENGVWLTERVPVRFLDFP